MALSLTHQLLILEHTEGPKTLVTFETFDQIDETDQQKDNDKGPFTYYVSRRRGEGGKPKAKGCGSEKFSTKGFYRNKNVDKEGNWFRFYHS